MNKTKARMEDLHQIPCGVMGISADSVCRRSLRDSMDKLLDRLTLELHPSTKSDKLPKNFEADEEGNLVEMVKVEGKETSEERKKRLIDEGRMKAEVKMAIKSYEEELQGNSKMLQDVTGKIKEW